MKPSEIVKPSNLDDFVRLQLSIFLEGSFSEDMETTRFLLRLDHQQSHLPGKPIIELLVIYEVVRTSAPQFSFLVTENIETALGLFDKTLTGKEIARELSVAWVECQKGLLLQPVHISKPWGQEIWYTGIESRGVSQVKTDEGVSPLDWVIAAAPEHILGAHKTPALLKILDPLPDEVFGDLYFEMHEKKQEVYIVTHVDERAWPEGKGGIRFGFNQALRKSFSSDVEFRKAYLTAVQNYRIVRQQIDSLLDQTKKSENIGLNDPVLPEKIKQWQIKIPKDLMEQEKHLREKMESFIAIKPLLLGDVVKVPCLTPHSLQHGVRTVEFQTPVYERKILSFAQKVLTQPHWDTESALDQLILDAPDDTLLTVLEKNESLCRELVVQFNDFRVERIRLAADARLLLPTSSYRLLMVISGEIMHADQSLFAEQAKLIVANCDVEICASETGAVILLAEPLPSIQK